MMLPYGRQLIDDDDIQAVIEALKGDFLTTGPYVAKFEEDLCASTGAKYAVACSNGTTALHLACMAVGLKEGDCAIVPSVTFLATANAARYCGADVLFCDVDPNTGLMTPRTFQKALEEAQQQNLNVRAVLPVHLAGRPVDLEEICDIAKAHQIKVIADACHALGGEYNNSPIGSGVFEDLSIFSFHPVKTIATGEGGAVTTNDEAMAQRIKEIRHHNMIKTQDMLPWEYEMRDLGYNYRITDIQCALGISQLKKLSSFVEKRSALVALYNEILPDVSPHIDIHQRASDDENVSWHLYSARFDFEKLGIPREIMMQKLREQGIGTQVHYIPVHTQPYYTELYGHKTLQGADSYYRRTLSLPLYPSMELQDVRRVIDIIIHVIAGQ
ncbi:MAG: UDP-4-amino-4,6-dideoxy-N-acetyl-beta-L-altrosamine transaminase [Alphaproteobacteria bacterium]